MAHLDKFLPGSGSDGNLSLLDYYVVEEGSGVDLVGALAGGALASDPSSGATQGGAPHDTQSGAYPLDKETVYTLDPRAWNGTHTISLVGNVSSERRDEGAVDTPKTPQDTEDTNHQAPALLDYSKVLSTGTDPYGFKKDNTFFGTSAQTFDAWFTAYHPTVDHQRKKWRALFKASGLEPSGTRFPPKSDKTKKLVRKGIPPEMRGRAWFFYAGGHERLSKNRGIYAKVVSDSVGVKNKDTDVIERDLLRTFPDNVHFAQGSSMITALRRVLTAFAAHQPHIGYCQLLNFIAGMLLLFMAEEHAFWMLVIMTERIIPKVHLQTLEGVHTDQGVLMLCVKEYIPKLWAVIGKGQDGRPLLDDTLLARLPPVLLVTLLWFMLVFVGVLPVELVLRVWDIIWYEGLKTIFRILLTLCRLCLDQPQFGREQHDEEQIELYQFMQNYPKSLGDPNTLIDCCFKKIGGYGYGFISQDEINKCRDFVARQRNKLQKRHVPTQLSDDERQALQTPYHDVYGFNRPIMSGVTWNMNISSKMRRKFSKK